MISNKKTLQKPLCLTFLFLFSCLILRGSPSFASTIPVNFSECINRLNLDNRQTILHNEVEQDILTLIEKIARYKSGAAISKMSDRDHDRFDDLISSLNSNLTSKVREGIQVKKISDQFRNELVAQADSIDWPVIAQLNLNAIQAEKYIADSFSKGDTWKLTQLLPTFQLSPARKIQIAKQFAASKISIWFYLKSLKLNPEELEKDWFPLCFPRDFNYVTADRFYLSSLSQTDRSKMAIALQPYGEPFEVLKKFTNANYLTDKDIETLAIQDIKKSPELILDPSFSELLLLEPLASLKKLALLQSDFKTMARLAGFSLDLAIPVPEVKKRLNDTFGKLWPELVPLFPSLFGKVSNQKTALLLLANYIRRIQTGVTFDIEHLSVESLESNFRNISARIQTFSSQDSLLSYLTGLPLKSLESVTRKNLLREIYFVALDIQDHKNIPFTQTLGLEFKSEFPIEGEQFLRLLVVLRDRINMGSNPIELSQLTKELAPTGISPSSIDNLINGHREHLFKTISSNLKMEWSPSATEIADLEDRWNGLDPVLTLLGRYISKDTWIGLLPSLGKTFEHSLKHTFNFFKFFGDPQNPEDQTQSRKQLATLKTPQAIRSWTKSRSIAKNFVGIPVTPDIQDLSKELSDIVKSNIIGEIEMESNPINYTDKKDIYAHLAKREGSRKIFEDFVATNSDHVNSRRISFEQLLRTFAHYPPSSLKEMRKLLALIYIGKDQVADDFTPEELAQMQKNLDDMNARINSWARMGESKIIEGLIVTTINSNPKFLLTIGDLVETVSCQNYRTGSHIEALMGYVIDANVQGLASFFIGPENFESLDIYRKISAAANEGQLNVSFDGNKRTARFQIVSSKDIVEVNLPKALYRSMIKLGETKDGKTGLKMERAYTPSYKADYLQSGLNKALAENAKELFARLLKDLDATSEGPITVAGSRSPGGVYTDLGGGTKLNDYQIP